MKTITITEKDYNEIINFLRTVQVQAHVGASLVTIATVIENGLVKEKTSEKK